MTIGFVQKVQKYTNLYRRLRVLYSTFHPHAPSVFPKDEGNERESNFSV